MDQCDILDNEYNRQLYKLYRKYWDETYEFLKKLKEEYKKDISYPLLLYVFNTYKHAKIKLLIIGQQTLEWDRFGDFDKSGDIICELMRSYRDFKLGDGTVNPGSPFWRAARILYETLNPSYQRYGFMWTNIIKIDQHNKSKNRYGEPDDSIKKEMIRRFPVVPYEIKILKPDVVVFFTGPNYDWCLKETFPQAKFSNIPPFRKHELSFVRDNKILPKLTFRTYHPNYLQRSKNKELQPQNVINTIIEITKKNIKK